MKRFISIYLHHINLVKRKSYNVFLFKKIPTASTISERNKAKIFVLFKSKIIIILYSYIEPHQKCALGSEHTCIS